MVDLLTGIGVQIVGMFTILRIKIQIHDPVEMVVLLVGRVTSASPIPKTLLE